MNAYILVYDFFKCLPKLVEDIRRLGATPIIIDNASTYPPLLEWYDKNENNIDINRLPINLGPLGAVRAVILPKREKRSIVTDCDLDISSVPDDAIDILGHILDKYTDVCKVGFSLEIDDLPDNVFINEIVLPQQKVFWEKRRDNLCFEAEIDTTFVMCDWRRMEQKNIWRKMEQKNIWRKMKQKNILGKMKQKNIRRRRKQNDTWYGPALRTDKPYCARHIPWYYTKENIDDNLKYLIEVSSKKYVGANNFPILFDLIRNKSI